MGEFFSNLLGTDLLTALRTVARGEAFLYPSVATTVVEEIRRQSEAPEGYPNP